MEKQYFAYIGDFCTAVRECARLDRVVDLGVLPRKHHRDLCEINEDKTVAITPADKLTAKERLEVHSRKLQYRMQGNDDNGNPILDIDVRLQPLVNAAVFLRGEMEAQQEADSQAIKALSEMMVPVPGKGFMFATSGKGNPKPAPKPAVETKEPANVTVNIGNLNELRNVFYEGNVMAAHTKEVDKWHTSSMEKHDGTGWRDLVDEYFPELRNDMKGRENKASVIKRAVKVHREKIDSEF